MPVILDGSNININYSTSNFDIQTVKSEIYIPDTTNNSGNIINVPIGMNEIIKQPLSYEPMNTNIIFEDFTFKPEEIRTFTHSGGTENQTTYSINIEQDVACDILIVGGGGAGGGRQGGGGGAGGLMFLSNLTLTKGTHAIKVGRGGNIAGDSTANNGIDSELDLYIAYGGSGGAGYSVIEPDFNITTNRFGSGGGGMGWNNNSSYTGYNNANERTNQTNPSIQGGISNKGGRGYQDPVGGDSNSLLTGFLGGGGGGAGGIGQDATPNDNTSYTGKAGNGRLGLDYSFVFGKNVGSNGWFAGGGGGAGASISGDIAGSGNNGGLGGGGSGNSSGTGLAGTNGTGGGGGGGGYANQLGGVGGSGIVIIKFKTIVNTEEIRAYSHSGGAENQSTYNITVGQNTICDILIVGGGGAGGGRQGGGGGAGGIMCLTNQKLVSGTYTIKVGKGGTITGTSADGTTNVIANNGIDSEFGNYIAYGGSGGAGFSTTKSDFNITTNRFGSGGGGMGWNNNSSYIGYNNANEMINQTNPSIQGGSAYKGGRGWQNYTGGDNNIILTGLVGGGGGGAGGLGQDAIQNINNATYTGKGGDGGIGLYFGNLFGTNIGNNGWFGGGGGGSGLSTSSDIPGIGGIGGGGNANTNINGEAGMNGTGGGGGAGGYPNRLGGVGGSGIVIVRLRTIICKEEIRTFTHSGGAENQSIYNLSIEKNTLCDILVVAGGGGGGKSIGGGGGAGGLVYITNYTLMAGIYTISVGKGGIGQTQQHVQSTEDGKNSTINLGSTNIITAIGGATGQGQSPAYYGLNNRTGGSGAGGTRWKPSGSSATQKTATTGISSTNGYGNNGGDYLDGSFFSSGGGGGAGNIGGNGTSTKGGDGGNGLIINITGTNTYYAGGGGGISDDNNTGTTNGSGGLGGGGAGRTGGVNGIDGTNGLGGGGGAGGTTGADANGGNGGSGIVIIKMKTFINNSVLNCSIQDRNSLIHKTLNFTNNENAYINYLTGMDNWVKIKHKPATKIDSYSGNTFNSTSISGTFTIGNPNDNNNEWAIEFNEPNVKFYLFILHVSQINSNYKDLWMVFEASELKRSSNFSSTYNYHSAYIHAYKTTMRPYGFAAKNSTNYNGPDYDQFIYNRTSTFGDLPDPNISMKYITTDGVWLNIGTQVYADQNTHTGGYIFLPVTGGVYVKYDNDIPATIPYNKLTFNYRTDESPYSWQEACNEAISIKRRLPTINELKMYITNYPSVFTQWNNLDYWTPVINPLYSNGKDWVQIGNNASHVRGKSHTETLGYPGWGDNSTSDYSKIYFDVFDTTTPKLLTFSYRTDESPYSWQEAYDEAIANSRRIPTIIELREYITNYPNVFTQWNNLDYWTPVINLAYANSKDWVQIGNNASHVRGKSHTETFGYPSWGDDSTSDYAKIYFEVIETYLNTHFVTFEPGTQIEINEDKILTADNEYIISLSNTSALVRKNTNNIIENTNTIATINSIFNTSNIINNVNNNIIYNSKNKNFITIKYSNIKETNRYANERMYPPLLARNFTSTTTIVSGQSYGNGTYVVTGSSIFHTGQLQIIPADYTLPCFCFNESNTIGGNWAITNYDTSFNYVPTNKIIESFDNGLYYGEWLKIKLPIAIKLTKYSIKQRLGFSSNSPGKFRIYGSNNDIDWVLLIDKTSSNITYINGLYTEIAFNIYSQYIFFVLVVGSTLSSRILNFDEWYLYGDEFTNIIEPVVTPGITTIERMYPPVRNFTAATTTVSGQSYGNGTYIITSSSEFNSTTESKFNIFNGTNQGWTQTASGFYTGTPSGTYTGTFSLAGYSGEWVKVQLPVPINLTRYIIEAGNIGGTNRAPAVYKIFGSNDNINWVELVNKSNPLVVADYVSSKYEEKVSTSNYYRYLALVINRNMGLAGWLTIGEWYIYGKESYDIKTFVHSGGTENQTSHSISFEQNTLCDILIVGGGGGGGKTDAGGGGAGGLIYIQNIILSGNYNIRVGKGGLGGTSGSLVGIVGDKGGNSSIVGTNANYIAYGGGGGGYGHPSDVEPINLGPYGSTGGLGTSDQSRENSNVNTPGQGYLGGLGSATQGGGGGGGSGGPGSNGGTNGGNGGIGTQVNITGTNLYYAGGGGGGHGPGGSSGGLGGGGSGFEGAAGTNATFYGGGGGGGGGNWTNGGNGFAGVVIIRIKSNVGAATSIGNPVSQELLTFNYVPSYPFVDKSLLIHYKFDELGNGEGYLDSSGNGYNLTAKSGNIPIFSSIKYVLGRAAFENGSNGSTLVIPNEVGSQLRAINVATGISLSFWFNLSITNQKDNWADILCFMVGTDANKRGIIIGQQPTSAILTSSNDPTTWISSSNRLFVGMQDGATNPYGYVGKGKLDREWHHFVWTITTTGVWAIYIDNVLQTYEDVNQSTSGIIPNYSYTTNEFFGGSHVGHNNGYIDDFRIYKGVLTTAEITTLYNINSPEYPKIPADNENLKAWYKFDDEGSNEGYLDSNPTITKHNLIVPSGSTPIFSSNQKIFGKSAYEQGVEARIQFPTSLTDQLYTINNTNGITFSLWYNMSTSSGTWASIFEFSETATDTNNTRRFGIARDGANNQISLIMKDYIARPTDYYYLASVGSGTINNAWHHIVWSISSTGVWTCYVDNVNQNINITAKIPNITSYYNFSYILGSIQTTQTFSYVDDFRIYDKVLSLTEVSMLYHIPYVNNINTYTINFPVDTIANINDNANYIFKGKYDINLTSLYSQIIPKENQKLGIITKFPTSTMQIKYNIYNPISNLLLEPFVNNDNFYNSYVYENYTYTGTLDTTKYYKSFAENTICDILVVGGGGGGGGAGGSGGGGSVVEFLNVNVPAGNYVINVGRGGATSVGNNGLNGSNGITSSFIGNNINIKAAGGGGGGQYNSNSAPTPPTETYVNPLTNISQISQGGGGGVRFNGLPYSMNTSLSGAGGINTDNNAVTGGAGGGASPASLGGNGGNSYLIGSVAFLGNGGRGVISAITNMEYGGGGAGSRWNPEIKNTLYGYATGGGGNAELIGIESTNNNVHLGVQIHADKDRGGGAYSSGTSGSGTVILRYRKYNTGIDLNNQKKLNFNYIPDTIVYDFTPFNNLTDWREYAKSIGATTSFNTFQNDEIWWGNEKLGFIHLPLTNYLYDTVTVTYNNGHTSGTVNLYINGVIKSSCSANQTKTYTQKYVPGDILRVEEGIAELGANLIITLSNANIVNRYNINFPVNTTIDVNKENKSVILRGNYNIVNLPTSINSILTFTNTTANDTVTYTQVFDKATICDILIVAGGGGGGMNSGAGGGAGGLILLENIIISAGIYTIKVGRGGAGGTTINQNTFAEDGKNSSFGSYTAIGGGAGANSGGSNGRTGGSGGGTGNDMSGNRTGGAGTPGQGFKGGDGNHPGGSNRTGGGGGGAGGAGQNSVSASQGGNGGIGRNMTSYFGISYGVSGWFAGGGGGGGGQGTGGTGGTGGGGNGGSSNQEGVNGTGGGGGAANGNQSTQGKKGGSGIVIIKQITRSYAYINTATTTTSSNNDILYNKLFENTNIDLNYNTTIATSNIITEPYVTSLNDNLLTFTHSGGSENQTTYSLNIQQNVLCDILIVAGGGAGGNDRGGGGGGGGVIFSENVTLNGNYIIMVGNGGIGSTSGTTGGSGTRGTNGGNSSISGTNFTTLTAIGGGAGGSCATGGIREGISGGSGGGGSHFGGAGSGGTSTIGQGQNGGIGYEGGAAGGGGGFINIGTNASSTNAGNGGLGLSNSITGVRVTYGSGGGGGGSNGSGVSSYNQVFGIGGSSGAGNGSNVNTNGGNGTSSTGGGGGGAGMSNGVTTKGGNGGSGVVIIRYKITIIDVTSQILTAQILSKKYPETPSTNSDSWIDNGYNVICKTSDNIFDSRNTCYLFNNLIVSPDHYHSAQLFSGSSPFNYTGSTSFKGANGLVIYIDLGRSIVLNSMRIAPRDNAAYSSLNFLNAMPNAFKIYASNNNACWNDNNHSSWIEIHSQTSQLTYNYNQYTNFGNFSANTASYRYFAMVTYNLIGNYTYLTFSEWNIFGLYDRTLIANLIDNNLLQFPHSGGNENQTTYQYTFQQDAVCDILLVGGGGGGGQQNAGGGGAGGLVLVQNLQVNGRYTINVGKGGNGGNGPINVGGNGNAGNNSTFVKSDNSVIITANGGGGGGGGGAFQPIIATNGGSGGGGGWHSVNGVQTQKSQSQIGITTPTILNQFGENGGHGGGDSNSYPGGGGGGAGGVGGTSSSNTTGQNGGLGIDRVGTYVFSQQFSSSIGDNGWFAGGGGSGGDGANEGYGNGGSTLFGGGGNGDGIGRGINGISGTGGGGGAIRDPVSTLGGNGGSGIVIIKIKYYINSPIVQNLLTFNNNGSNTETYMQVFEQDTLCDILIVGGGGGGSAGGGGAGGYVYLSNIFLNCGTYTIRVGNGGTGATLSTSANQGFNSSLIGGYINYIAYGGGGGGGNAVIAPAHTAGQVGSYGGNGHDFTTEQTYTSTQGNRGGRALVNSSGSGGGGGGAGAIGNNAELVSGLSSQPTTTAYYRGGQGGIGIANNITGTLIYYAGGGTAGVNTNKDADLTNKITVFGGGGFGSRANNENGTDGINGLGGGGGGGDWERTAGTKGGSGIVIIKIKGNINISSLDGITHKKINFNYLFDKTTYNEYMAQYYTGGGKWKIVRYLPPTSTSWYPINDNLAGTTSVGTSYDYTNFWTIPFGNYDEFVFATFNMKYWLHVTREQAIGTNYDGASRIILRSSISPNPYSVTWYNRANVGEDPLIGLRSHSTAPVNNPEAGGDLILYGENSYTSTHWSYPAIAKDGGLCILVRNTGNTGMTTETHPPQNYEINFPIKTLVDVNNTGAFSLVQGKYNINIGTFSSSITPKEGQYLQKPNTFTYNIPEERMYPPLRNFTTSSMFISGQSYGNGLYNVKYSTFRDTTEPFQLFNENNTTGGHWEEVTKYDSTTGIYIGTDSLGGYSGDWVTIQLPVAIRMTRYMFKQRPDVTNGSPRNFRIYGSNNGYTWVQLINRTDITYLNLYYNETNILLNGYYSYYGLVVNATTGNRNLLNFDEWYIYGYEMPASSLELRYQLLNPVKDSIGAQWTYNSSNINVYHMGNVGIGTKLPEYSLHVDGYIYTSATAYTSSTKTKWTTVSDRRIKENIVKASYKKCLENVKNIELYRFNLNNNNVKTNDKNQLGFIAQEVQKIYPKAVETNKIIDKNNLIPDLLTLNTTQIDYTLFGAVKELINKVENIGKNIENITREHEPNIEDIKDNVNIISTPITNISLEELNNINNITEYNDAPFNLILANSSNIITIDTSNIAIDTLNITIDTSNISIDTSNIIIIDTSNISIDTSNIAK